MLTADLVRCRVQQGRLHVLELSGKAKQRAVELAELYLELARQNVGATTETLKLAWQNIEVGPRERKVAAGLQKLIEDACQFEVEAEPEPRQLRSVLFMRAAQERRLHRHAFDRGAVLRAVGAELGHDVEQLERALFADLPSQHVLLGATTESAAALVERFERAQFQAVLLRAVRISAWVRVRDVQQARALFRALKFHRLLFVMQREGEGYRLEIDGPFSLFESVTKYGLQLALVFPILCDCEQLKLRADLRWGKARVPVEFEFESRSKDGLQAEPDLSPEARALCQAIDKLGGWHAEANSEILELPGIGLCIPDLRVRRGQQVLYVELMGFWSRDAVFKRVELVERGLAAPVIFAVSSRLRVSEALLADTGSALYVYKGVPQARALLDKAAQLLQRSS
jgi:predicted nuclease of restriction endonuclease-like RecB superfamily